jgi:hypothetical protein
MKNNLVDKLLLPKTAWVLVLLIPITFLGFFPSYFSKLTTPIPMVIHVHGVLMLMWLLLSVLQPFLIYYKKIRYHRLVGKISYIIMPVVIISGYMILKYSYQRALNGDSVGPPGYYPESLAREIIAAEFVVIGSVYWVWLVVYYTLGILFRKNLVAHATFMLAAALTILGPAGDRLIGITCDALGLPYNAFAQNFIFVFVLVIFSIVLIIHYNRQLKLWPVVLVLLLQLTGFGLFHYLPYHPVWNQLAAILY